jgi:glycosyltransferase involved in cell wall biosynthesis
MQAAHSRVAELQALVDARSDAVGRLDSEQMTTRNRVGQLLSSLQALESEISAIRLSTSWRLTAPLRRIGTTFPWLARPIPRSLKFVRRALAIRLAKRVRDLLRRRPDIKLVAASGLFDRDWYLERNPDVRSANIDPLIHYLRHGAAEGRDPNPLFDSDWYFLQNPDVERSGLNPLAHYIRFGAAEGRQPSPFFDGRWYLARNPHVAATGVNPLTHYLSYGAKESRAPHEPRLLLRGVKVAVIVHVFYGELWDEIASWLRNIPIKFDLYVSVPMERAPALRGLVQRYYPKAQIVEVPNVGRDVGAFFSVLPLVLAKGYTAIGKFHTKKGILEPEVWRQLMFRGLLGHNMLVTRILRAFQTDPDLYLVGPRDLYISGRTFPFDNAPNVEKIVHQLYPGRSLPEEWGFFAGTMFWASPKALENFVYTMQDKFSYESDNTAHAIERIFGLVAAMENKRIGLTDVTGRESLDGDVSFLSAPGNPSQTALTSLLTVRAEEFRSNPTIMPQSFMRRLTELKGKEPGVNLIGPIEFDHGLGVSARGFMSSLMQAGVRLNVIPWRFGFERLRPRFIDYPSTDLQPINLIHLNLDLLSSQRLLDTPPLVGIATPDCYNIAIVYWELASVPPEWFDVIHRFDEIWCASSFVARSIAAVSARPVRIVRPAVEARSVRTMKTRSDFGLPDGRFLFFYASDAGRIIGRKNPQALIDAYLEEFTPDEGTCCLIKLSHADPHSRKVRDIRSIAVRRPDLILMEEVLSVEEMSDLFERIDCYVSPHRSEGLGLTVLEAMLAKKPVIATSYGGVTDFVNPETALTIDYQLIEIGKGQSPYSEHYIWADPLRSSIRSAMRSIFQDADLAKSVGLKGYAVARDMFSLDRTAKDIQTAIERIWNRGGAPPS